MRTAFLIGYPVSHSLSPALQNASFSALGIEARYELLETPPGTLARSVERLAMTDALGANVTVPYKQTVIPFLDAIDDSAQQIGAVNTLVKRNGRLVGANTDADGIPRALADVHVKPACMHVVVLGAGGAAHAAVFALAASGAAQITIINRTIKRALALQRVLALYYPGIGNAVNRLDNIEQAQMIVNATSVGMAPAVKDTPMPPGHSVPRGAIAFDLVYRPRETRFLRDARLAGALTIDGMGMLLHQGRASFQLWTGREAPGVRSLYAAVLNGG